MNVPDYGRYAPGPPTAKALAERDRLAEEMAAAPEGSAKRRAARSALVDLILAGDLPPESFSTSSGRRFAVHFQKPRVLTPEVKRWLAGRDFGNAMREDGGGPFPIRLTVSEKK